MVARCRRRLILVDARRGNDGERVGGSEDKRDTRETEKDICSDIMTRRRFIQFGNTGKERQSSNAEEEPSTSSSGYAAFNNDSDISALS